MKIKLSILVLVIAGMLVTTGFLVSQPESKAGRSLNAVNPFMNVHVGWVTEYVVGDHITIQTHKGSM